MVKSASILTLLLALCGAVVSCVQADSAQPLASFSWEGDPAERDQSFRQLANEAVAQHKSVVEAIALLHTEGMPPRARLILSETVLDRFAATLFEDAERAASSSSPPWICTEIAAVAADTNDPDAARLFDRLVQTAWSPDQQSDAYREMLQDGAREAEINARMLAAERLLLGVCLGAAGRVAEGAIERAVENPDPRTRGKAAYWIGLLQLDAHFGRLPGLLSDPEVDVRVSAAAAVELTRHSALAEPLAKAIAGETDPGARAMLLRFLASLESPIAQARIVQELTHVDPEVRIAAARACLWYKEQPPCLDGLMSRLREERQEDVLVEVIAVLGQSHNPEIRQALASLAEPPDAARASRVVDAARQALEQFDAISTSQPENAAGTSHVQKRQRLEPAELEALLKRIEGGQEDIDSAVEEKLLASVDKTAIPRIRLAFQRLCRHPASLDLHHNPAFALQRVIAAARRQEADRSSAR